MAGTPLKNLRMFEELCGKNAFHNVILVTTMWDEVDEETGEDREEELKTKYWRTMLDRSSTTSRFLRTRESAFDIIEPLIEAANIRSSLLLQDELVDMRKSLPVTSAGQESFSAMGQLVTQHKNLLRRIRYEMRHSNGDKMVLKSLQEEHEKHQKILEATVIETRRLRLPLGKRLMIMADKNFSSKFEFLKSWITERMSKPATPITELPTLPIGSHVDHIRTGTISSNLIDRTLSSSPGSTPFTPLPIANVSNVLTLGQSDKNRMDRSKPTKLTKPEENWSQTNHSTLISTTKEQVQDNTVSSDQTTTVTETHTIQLVAEKPAAPITESPALPIDSYTPLSHVDHARTGTISKDPIDSTLPFPPGSTSHTQIANGPSVLTLGQGPTTGKVRTDRSKPLASPIECFPPPPSLADATGQSRRHTPVLQGTISALKLIQQIAGLAPVPGLQSLVGVVLNISELVNVSFCATYILHEKY